MTHKIFYISDTHFGCDVLPDCEYYNLSCEQFSSMEERESVIIERWNEKVSPEDEVYIVGDYSEYDFNKTIEMTCKLNGIKHLIRGNHDEVFEDHDLLQSCFDGTGLVEIADVAIIQDEGREVHLSHYPLTFWSHQHLGTWHVYGHVHASEMVWFVNRTGKSLVDYGYVPEFRALNCGVMANGYAPVTLDELITANGLDEHCDDTEILEHMKTFWAEEEQDRQRIYTAVEKGEMTREEGLSLLHTIPDGTEGKDENAKTCYNAAPNSRGWFLCSECGFTLQKQDNDPREHDIVFHCCPNCQAVCADGS